MEDAWQIIAYCFAIWTGYLIHCFGYKSGIKANQKLITSLEEELNHTKAVLADIKAKEELLSFWDQNKGA